MLQRRREAKVNVNDSNSQKVYRSEDYLPKVQIKPVIANLPS
jgi:hypothetical protein